MIKDPDRMVKDFNASRMIKRRSFRMLRLNCAGCGTRTDEYDHLYGWHICPSCDSDEVAADLSDHVMNPTRGF